MYWKAARYALLQVLKDFQTGKRSQYLGVLPMHHIGSTIANRFAVGWVDRATNLATRSRQAWDHDGFNDSDDSTHRRVHRFLFRLPSHWMETSERGVPPYAYDEPTCNRLIEHYSVAEPGRVLPLLLAAYDRHTHETRVDSNKGHFDLPRLDIWYLPFEVLVVLKLRELQGLANLRAKELQHPLMSTLLGCAGATV